MGTETPQSAPNDRTGSTNPVPSKDYRSNPILPALHGAASTGDLARELGPLINRERLHKQRERMRRLRQARNQGKPVYPSEPVLDAPLSVLEAKRAFARDHTKAYAQRYFGRPDHMERVTRERLARKQAARIRRDNRLN